MVNYTTLLMSIDYVIDIVGPISIFHITFWFLREKKSYIARKKNFFWKKSEISLKVGCFGVK